MQACPQWDLRKAEEFINEVNHPQYLTRESPPKRWRPPEKWFSPVGFLQKGQEARRRNKILLILPSSDNRVS